MGDVSHERETLRCSDITQDHQTRGSAGSLLSNTKTLPEDPEGPDPQWDVPLLPVPPSHSSGTGLYHKTKHL